MHTAYIYSSPLYQNQFIRKSKEWRGKKNKLRAFLRLNETKKEEEKMPDINFNDVRVITKRALCRAMNDPYELQHHIFTVIYPE